MKIAISFTVAFIFWIAVTLAQMDLDHGLQAYQRLSYAVENASTAAAEQVTPQSISDGYPVFDQTQADQVFRSVLATNMQLDPTTLQPLANTMYQTAPSILLEQFVDYSNTPSFPVHYVNSQYNIDTMINGPSIVFVVSEQAPRLFTTSPSFTMTWSIVAAYKGY